MTPNNHSLYLHSIFIVSILGSRSLFRSLYTEGYQFKWSMDFHPVMILFYILVLLVIYFTVFVILKERPQLKRPVARAIKISGFVAMFFLFIPLRWFFDQKLSAWLVGVTNYPKEVDLDFYFHDNLVVAFGVMMVALFLKFMNDWYVNDPIKSALEKQNLQLELSFLKSQVNPHFLFNTLNNIQSYIVQNEKLKSIELIGRLSEFMRFSLYECNEEFIDLDKEIAMLYDYIELEKVRCEDRLKISFAATGDFNGYQIPPLLLMTFVENAFKHGSDGHSDQSYIKISISLDINKLHLHAENTFSESKLIDPKSGGIGIQNVKRRLKHYFGNQHTLQINTVQDIFKVDLHLSLNPIAENDF